jgi:alkanesulfonate monooxygenase SsuD/methylene tetrahydromethanopterin reductase-like flavin-dependent oxidoreductase (luciferase family)
VRKASNRLKFILSSWGNWYKGWESVKNIVPEADGFGYWGFVMPDHYMWGMKMDGDSTLDSWIALTYLAARTERIRLGTLVTPIPFRPPAILAKMVATFDLISNGRAILGVGAGWSQTEFEGYSKWDEPRTRVDRTVEGLELILKLWKSEEGTTSSPASFSGKYYSAKNAVLDPKPIQKPHPPLLFGSAGPRMCRLAGKYADICLVPPWLPPDKGAEAKKMVIEEAEKQGRQDKISFADILREAMSESASPQSLPPRYDSAAYAKGVENIRQSGCEYVIIPVFGSYETVSKVVKSFAQEVMPSFS